jgi:hypothetical protein
MLARLSRTRYLCVRLCKGAFSRFSRPDARHFKHKSNPMSPNSLLVFEEEEDDDDDDDEVELLFVFCFCVISQSTHFTRTERIS